MFYLIYSKWNDDTPVQIHMEAYVSINPDYEVSGSYYCSFLAKYPSNSKKSNDTSRCWPDWYRYTCDSMTNHIVFGDCILFWPNVVPSHKKYIQWGGSVNLLNEVCLLLGSFDFEVISPQIRTRCKIALNEWIKLMNIYS